MTQMIPTFMSTCLSNWPICLVAKMIKHFWKAKLPTANNRNTPLNTFFLSGNSRSSKYAFINRQLEFDNAKWMLFIFRVCFNLFWPQLHGNKQKYKSSLWANWGLQIEIQNHKWKNSKTYISSLTWYEWLKFIQTRM